MKRIKQPSTWAGIGLIAQGIGMFFGIDAAFIGTIVGGIGAVFLQEKAA